MREALTLADGTTAADRAAVSRLSEALTATPHDAHVAGVSTSAGSAQLFEVGQNGAGWALGRYAGQLTLDGHSVLIEPRIGWDALDGWVAAATGLHVPVAVDSDTRGRLTALASMLWVRAVEGASRHGPPSFRRDVPYVGGNMRGHLDVKRTVRLRAKGDSSAASVYRARELDNPVTRIIVAADRVLARQVGQTRWRTDRVDAVLAQLHTAVGRRSHAPGDGELHRMRYTPITRQFKWAAELSSRIVRQDPLATTALPGRVQGLVLDLDNIYGEATLNWSRDARPDLRAETVDSGQVVLRDRHEIRATLELLPAGSASGAPVLALSSFGAARQPLHLPVDAHEAAVVVRRALAAI
jgi:5-methylcytosine-specific restriction enzyme subunit McrC